MESRAYYNEIDPKAAAWLRELIKRNLICVGEVDERSIKDVQPDDLRGFTQCHFFAGIGVWSYALRRAGWDDARPVWTGSCPCQPFSAAGKGEGFDDERHLWPEFFRLIRECRPDVCFGEQVARKAGRKWLDLVCTDLEEIDYAVGAVDFPAAGVGAPHIRQRLYWVADAGGHEFGARRDDGSRREVRPIEPSGPRATGLLGYAGYAGPQGYGQPLVKHDAEGRDAEERHRAAASVVGVVGDTDSVGEATLRGVPGRTGIEREGGFWAGADWLPCRDGKSRPVEPGTFPLAHGAPARVVRLRCYGNAIVAPQAQAFIEAYLDVVGG